MPTGRWKIYVVVLSVKVILQAIKWRGSTRLYGTYPVSEAVDCLCRYDSVLMSYCFDALD